MSDCSCATSKLTKDRRPLISARRLDTDRLALAVSTFDQSSPPVDPSAPPGLSIRPPTLITDPAIPGSVALQEQRLPGKQVVHRRDRSVRIWNFPGRLRSST